MARPVTIDDLFNVTLVGDPRLSPDGTQVAYVVSRLDKAADDYRSAVWLVPTAGGEPRHQIGQGRLVGLIALPVAGTLDRSRRPRPGGPFGERQAELAARDIDPGD